MTKPTDLQAYIYAVLCETPARRKALRHARALAKLVQAASYGKYGTEAYASICSQAWNETVRQ